jgi:hypothetical protein
MQSRPFVIRARVWRETRALARPERSEELRRAQDPSRSRPRGAQRRRIQGGRSGRPDSGIGGAQISLSG